MISNAVKDVKKFTLDLCKVGYFGSPQHVKVIWIGVKEGKDNVIQLSKNMNKELLHIKKDDFKPSPHITIGRVRSNRNMETLIRELCELKNVKLCEVDVNEIKLKQSILHEYGPVYSDYKVFTLG